MNHLKVLAIRIDFIDTYQYVNHIGEGSFYLFLNFYII